MQKKVARDHMAGMGEMEGGLMPQKPNLPYDVRQECLWIVRGYDRRVKAYHEARQEIIDGSVCGFAQKKNGDRVYLPHSSGTGRPAENKMEQLVAIEDWSETRKMRAVENAKLHIGLDLQNEELRQRLAEGIWLNCQRHKQYPYALLNLPGIESTGSSTKKQLFCVISQNFSV